MGLAMLAFVNLSRQDAFLSVQEPNGDLEFVAKILPGTSERQVSTPGWVWSVVSSDTFEITADDKNHVYLIGAGGVYVVEKTSALTAESGMRPTDAEFPLNIGGGG